MDLLLSSPGPLWALAGALLLGLGLWLRSRSGPPGARRGCALHVTARAGLSPRCALALVEAHGQRFLIAHGDGFAHVHPLSRDGGCARCRAWGELQ
jgi:hypothetical protein